MPQLTDFAACWVCTDRWWTARPIVRAFCSCGWATPNMVTLKRAWDEADYHKGKCPLEVTHA